MLILFQGAFRRHGIFLLRIQSGRGKHILKKGKSCLIGNVVTVILEDAHFTQTAVM